MKINGKVISEPKSKLTIKNDPYLTFKMKFNKNKWDIKFMSIVCFDSLAKEVKIIDSLINDPVCQYLYKELSLDKLTIYVDLIKYFIFGEFNDYFEKLFGFVNPKLNYKLSYSLKRTSRLAFKFHMQKSICKHLEILYSNFSSAEINVDEFFNWLIYFINFYVAFQIQQILNNLNDVDNLEVQLFIKENNQSILYSKWIEKLSIND